MIDFLAQTQPTVEQLGLYGGGGLGALILYIFGPTIRERLPGASAAPKCVMRKGDSEVLHDIHKVTEASDSSGRPMVYFDKDDITRQHDKQNDALNEISKSQERIATILEMIERKQ